MNLYRSFHAASQFENRIDEIFLFLRNEMNKSESNFGQNALFQKKKQTILPCPEGNLIIHLWTILEKAASASKPCLFS